MFESFLRIDWLAATDVLIVRTPDPRSRVRVFTQVQKKRFDRGLPFEYHIGWKYRGSTFLVFTSKQRYFLLLQFGRRGSSFFRRRGAEPCTNEPQAGLSLRVVTISKLAAGQVMIFGGCPDEHEVLLLPIAQYEHFLCGEAYTGYTGFAYGQATIIVAPRTGTYVVLTPRLKGTVPWSLRPALMRKRSSRAVETVPPQVSTTCDVFVSHASEDKRDVVEPLADALRKRGLSVWYDESELRIGDSLRRKIDTGLVRSRLAVVVLSHAFFRKGWPNYELDAFVSRDASSNTTTILPILHHLTLDELRSYSPYLADKVCRATTDSGIPALAREIAFVAKAGRS